MRFLKKIFAVILALIAVGACAMLGYMFYTVAFLPPWVMITLLVFCAAGIVAAVKLMFMYIFPQEKSNLPPELDETEAEDQSDTIYSEKNIYRELK